MTCRVDGTGFGYVRGIAGGRLDGLCSIVARRVLGPREMEARNANLIGGAVNGGTSQLQQLFLRPVPGSGRAEAGIANLYLARLRLTPVVACTVRRG
jgi:hypothetical protein